MRQRIALWEDFARWGYDQRGWRPRTRETYKRRVAAADRWFDAHNRYLLRATPRELKEYLWSLQPHPTRRGHQTSQPDRAPHRNQTRAALIAFYDFLIDRDVVDTNPASALPRLPIQRPLPRARTADEMRLLEAIAQAEGPMIACAVAVLTYQGIRHEEIRTLRRQQIEGEEMRFEAKGGKERMLPLHPKVQLALRAWLPLCPDPVYVFPSPYATCRGKPLSRCWWNTMIRELGRAAGVDGLTLHAFRHTFATRLLQQTGNISIVKEALGHANVATTSIYLRVFSEGLRAAIDQLSFTEDSPRKVEERGA